MPHTHCRAGILKNNNNKAKSILLIIISSVNKESPPPNPWLKSLTLNTRIRHSLDTVITAATPLKVYPTWNSKWRHHTITHENLPPRELNCKQYFSQRGTSLYPWIEPNTYRVQNYKTHYNRTNGHANYHCKEEKKSKQSNQCNLYINKTTIGMFMQEKVRTSMHVSYFKWATKLMKTCLSHLVPSELRCGP